jgi:AP-1 complex subunit mu
VPFWKRDVLRAMQVRYLKIVEKSGYQALPWVRYITQNGEYQLRMN